MTLEYSEDTIYGATVNSAGVFGGTANLFIVSVIPSVTKVFGD